MKSKRDQLLGMSITTARSRLMRILLFEFSKQSSIPACYRCGDPIYTIEEFSIEHKQPWMQAKDPIKAYFDLQNIAFSHLKCNSEESHQRAKQYPSERERHNAANRRYYARKKKEKGGNRWEKLTKL